MDSFPTSLIAAIVRYVAFAIFRCGQLLAVIWPRRGCLAGAAVSRLRIAAKDAPDTPPHLAMSVTASWRRVQRTVSLLRSGSGDVTTADGRAQERHRRVALTALARAVVRALGIGVSLITVPLTLHYLGPERYGLWMTISSFIALLGFADLGMGSGLLNAISESHGRDDAAAARRYISSAFFMLLGVSLILGAVFIVAYPLVPWPKLFNVRSPLAIAEAGPAMLTLAACFLINIPLGIVERVRMGYQEGFSSSGWTGLGILLALLGLLTAIHFEAGLPWLVLAMSGGPLIALTLNGLALFTLQRPALRPSVGIIDASAATQLFKLGLLFFVIQIAMSLAYASQNVVASQILGPEAVTQYSVPFRLFAIPGAALGMILTPLWPAYGEAIARGDVIWVKRTLRHSLQITVVATSLTAIVLVLFGRQILHLWVGPEINPPLMLLVGLGIWTVLGAGGSAVAMFLNGVHAIQAQAVCAIIMALSSLPLSIILTLWIGLPGIIWATALSYVVFVALPLTFIIPKYLEQMSVGRKNRSILMPKVSALADSTSASPSLPQGAEGEVL